MTGSAEFSWLTIPEVCERLSLTPGKVHRLVEDRALLGMKHDGVFRIPDRGLEGSAPVADLEGPASVRSEGG
ncbi:MAG: helix-turn-helix domain-containing protein, partial [Pontimonas sp.]